jgi:hypothetical protein
MARPIKDIKELLDFFKVERYVYLSISAVSCVCILFCSTKAFFDGTISTGYFLGLFVPGGGIMFTTSRLLKMWDDSLEFIKDCNRNGG